MIALRNDMDDRLCGPGLRLNGFKVRIGRGHWHGRHSRYYRPACVKNAAAFVLFHLEVPCGHGI